VQAPAPVDVIADAARARVVLEPLRLRILAEAREPQSATSMAAALGLPRQNVNYHVRELARAGYLRKAGRQKKRGLTEQRWVASARTFVIGDDVLGPMSHAASAESMDKASVAYLLTLAARIQREAGRAWREAHAASKRLPVLSIDTEVSFRSPRERARFAEALAEAVTRVVAEYSSPATSQTSRPFRVVLGCYPIPPEEAR
jgi:DNA-binding transcriptional ArsR family regulator